MAYVFLPTVKVQDVIHSRRPSNTSAASGMRSRWIQRECFNSPDHPQAAPACSPSHNPRWTSRGTIQPWPVEVPGWHRSGAWRPGFPPWAQAPNSRKGASPTRSALQRALLSAFNNRDLHKELKNSAQFKNGWKTWTDTFSKKIHKWPTRYRKKTRPVFLVHRKSSKDTRKPNPTAHQKYYTCDTKWESSQERVVQCTKANRC